MIDTEALRKKVIDLAIQGKLTQQLPKDGNAEDLYKQIQEEKAKLIKEGKIKKENPMPEITEDEIPFEIPKNWKWVRVADIAFLSSGKAYEETIEGELYIKVSDMNLPENKTQIVTSTHFVSVNNDGIIPMNSIIFPKRGGAIATNKKRMILQNPVFVDLNTMGMTVILADVLMYVKYWFDTVKLNEIQNGTAIPQVNNIDIYPLVLPLPPLEEQKRIVAIIDGLIPQIDIIDTLQQQYETDREILKVKIIDAGIRGKLTEQLPEDGSAEDLYAQIQEEKTKLIKEGKIKKEKPLPPITEDEIPFDIPIDWKWVYLGEVFNHNTGKALNSSDKAGKKLEYITTSNLYWDHFELDNLKSMYFTESEIDKCTIIKGDLLVCEGGDIGRSAIWPYNYEMRIQNHIHRLRSYYEIDQKFYYYVLRDYKSSGMIDGRGIGLQGFSARRVHSLVVPLPPLAEQKRIVDRINELMGILTVEASC